VGRLTLGSVPRLNRRALCIDRLQSRDQRSMRGIGGGYVREDLFVRVAAVEQDGEARLIRAIFYLVHAPDHGDVFELEMYVA